jgi:uncharacterized protein (DUF433 family)
MFSRSGRRQGASRIDLLPHPEGDTMARTTVENPVAIPAAAPAKAKAERTKKVRADRPRKSPRTGGVALTDPAFDLFARSCRDELRPSGTIEEILVSRAIASAWRLRPEIAGEGDGARPEIVRAERSLVRGLIGLTRLRDSNLAVDRDRPTFTVPDPESMPDPALWRERLTMDPGVSPDSPVVRGTWVTVDQVISRIVDGWSWGDVLRAHPELCSDDIRACLAFTVEDEVVR